MVDKDEIVHIADLEQVRRGLLHGGRGHHCDLYVGFETGLEVLARVTLVDNGRYIVFEARPGRRLSMRLRVLAKRPMRGW